MLAQLQRNLREIIQAIAEGVYVHHGAPAHNKGFVALIEEAVHKGQGIGLINTGGIVARDGNAAGEVVLHGGHVPTRGGRRANAQFLIYLPGIAVYDG